MQLKMKCVGLYDKNTRLLEVHKTKTSASKSEANYAYKKEYFYVHPDQVELLSYSQGVDLETILYYAEFYKEQNEKRID